MLSSAVEDFASTAGGGVEAKLEGKRILGGNARLMAMRGIDLGAAEELARQLADEGKTPLYFAMEEKLCGVLALAAPVKELGKHTAQIKLHKDVKVEFAFEVVSENPIED
jgi:cation transport ATPase